MKKTKRPEQYYDMVEVWWDDAAGLRHGWMDRTEQPRPQMVISVGFIIIDTADHIIIAQDVDDNGAHNGRTQIPKGMLKKVKLLRKKDVKKSETQSPELSSSIRATELKHTSIGHLDAPANLSEKPALKDLPQ